MTYPYQVGRCALCPTTIIVSDHNGTPVAPNASYRQVVLALQDAEGHTQSLKVPLCAMCHDGEPDAAQIFANCVAGEQVSALFAQQHGYQVVGLRKLGTIAQSKKLKIASTADVVRQLAGGFHG